jgi:hypothetical protein
VEQGIGSRQPRSSKRPAQAESERSDSLAESDSFDSRAVGRGGCATPTEVAAFTPPLEQLGRILNQRGSGRPDCDDTA